MITWSSRSRSPSWSPACARSCAGARRSRVNSCGSRIWNSIRDAIARSGRAIRFNLTAKEFLLLAQLVRSAGEVVTRKEIESHVWGIDFQTGTNVLDVMVRRLARQSGRSLSEKLDPHCSRRRLCPQSRLSRGRLLSQLVFLFTPAAALLLCCGLAVLYWIVVRHAFEEDRAVLVDKVLAIRAELTTGRGAAPLVNELRTLPWRRTGDLLGASGRFGRSHRGGDARDGALAAPEVFTRGRERLGRARKWPVRLPDSWQVIFVSLRRGGGHGHANTDSGRPGSLGR